MAFERLVLCVAYMRRALHRVELINDTIRLSWENRIYLNVTCPSILVSVTKSWCAANILSASDNRNCQFRSVLFAQFGVYIYMYLISSFSPSLVLCDQK